MKFFIKEARNAAELTQKQLANMLGITDATLSGYETGSHDPKSKMLVEIAKICNTTTDYLLGLTDSMRKPESASLAPDEAKIIDTYRNLNARGQDALMRQVDYISSDPDMKKDGASNGVTA